MFIEFKKHTDVSMSAIEPATVVENCGVAKSTLEKTSTVTGKIISNIYVRQAELIPWIILNKKNRNLFIPTSFSIENIWKCMHSPENPIANDIA